MLLVRLLVNSGLLRSSVRKSNVIHEFSNVVGVGTTNSCVVQGLNVMNNVSNNNVKG